jgi:hypothetical protein
VRGLQVDERTLALIDTDGDGHVRPPEVIAAVSWACDRLADPVVLLKGGPELPVAAIGGPAGAPLAEAAAWILEKSGSGAAVAPAAAGEIARALAKGALKGDGILRPEAASDEPTQQLIRDIAASCGDVTEKAVEQFFSDLEAFRAWSRSGGASATAGFGPAASEAFEAVAAVQAKVVDYFARTELAAYDSGAAPGLNRTPEDFRGMAAGTLTVDAPELAALPLARIEPNRPLPLVEGVNPAWAAALSRLRAAAVAPLLGERITELTSADWDLLREKLRPYEMWVGTRPSGKVADLGIKRIDAILAGTGRQVLAALFTEDRDLAPRVSAAADFERLALFYRDLGRILRNFVNFVDFYSRSDPPMFQVGTLYLDSRSCRLCIQVQDADAHAAFGAMSRVYVAYLECRRKDAPVLKVAAAFTQGDSDYLFVGRNGVFYDSQGRDWDATIVKICDSPISIRQAFFAPYKKVASFVGDQFAKFAASKEQAVQSGLGAAVSSAPAQPAAAAQTFDIAKFAGIFAALGLAIGAIGGALASVFSGLMKAPPWMWPVAVGAALLVISGPSMVVAAIKLNQRNLGPLLEGTGWAVNGRVKINMHLGEALTDLGVLPPNSERTLYDPYADQLARTNAVAAILLLFLLVAVLLAARMLHTWPF